jgi:hypothetical protein
MLSKLYNAAVWLVSFIIVYWGFSQLYRMLDLSHGAAQ